MSYLETPSLTTARIRSAYVVAAAADALQLLAGPIGFAFFDEALDVVAAILIWRLLGFHPLLLPTFVLEFLPVADLLPSWTACVAIVVALRKRRQTTSIPPPPTGSVIDV
jgi:hypothetical protein